MNTARQAYQQSLGASWSRIDMLLALYGKSVQTLNKGIASLEKNDLVEFHTHRYMMYRCVTALLEGIDVTQGEIAENIQRLVIYAFELVSQDEVSSWQSALEIISQLQKSFMQIREEAMVLEIEGKILPLNHSSQSYLNL